MKVIGIICEYNPFHTGHKKQFDILRRQFGEDCKIVCLMSGNFVQRGHPAIFDKSLRAKAALLCGADLVLELPVTYALSSAEGFAAGGVRILSGFCDYLCFGSETGDITALMHTANILLSPDFSPILRKYLDTGISYPAARQKALVQMGGDGTILENPNDILAVEYCKAILSQKVSMKPLPILRCGSYHDPLPQPENPSATGLRRELQCAGAWQNCVPKELQALYETAPIHEITCGERAMLYRLRTLTDGEFEALPYGSEGLWRRLMHASRSCATLEEILTTVKTRRYPRSRLDRMVMCAFLGIFDFPTPSYTRVLGFRETGRAILNAARAVGNFPHIGEQMSDPYQTLEQRCDDLYGLFCRDIPQAPGNKRRIVRIPSPGRCNNDISENPI